MYSSARRSARSRRAARPEGGLEPVALGKQRVEGRLSSGGPRREFDDQFEFQGAFNAAVRPRARASRLDPKTAERLPPGGGEPGKTYVAMVQAIHKGDLDAVQKTLAGGQPVTPEMARQMKEMLPMLQAMTPKDVEVLGGLSGGDKAVLDVEAVAMGAKQKGTVEMTRSGGAWRQVKESWK
jgi:hypothetical protein